MQKLKGLRKLLVLTGALVLSGCNTLPNVDSNQSIVHRHIDEREFSRGYEKVAALKAWRFSAKASITTPRGTDQVNLDWVFHDTANALKLFGPLGMGAVKLNFDDYSVLLSDQSGALYEGNNPDLLLFDITGIWLPLSSLRYWLFGLADPNMEYRAQRFRNDATGDSGLLLEQLAWRVSFSRYQQWQEVGSFAQWSLPRRIEVTGQDAQGESVRIKVIVKSWNDVTLDELQ